MKEESKTPNILPKEKETMLTQRSKIANGYALFVNKKRSLVFNKRKLEQSANPEAKVNDQSKELK